LQYIHKFAIDSTAVDPCCSPTAYLSFINNIRSLPHNITEFQSYLNTLNIKCSVIGVTETWFQGDNYLNYNIDGYHSTHNVRSTSKAGGVSLFVRDHIPFTTHSDLTLLEKQIECTFIEIEKSHISSNQNVIVGVVYRPPDTSISCFNEVISDILLKIKHVNKKMLYYW
jgi:hypothetical protein